jgi:hypothetical protein
MTRFVKPSDEEFRAWLAALRMEGLSPALAERWMDAHINGRWSPRDYAYFKELVTGERGMPPAFTHRP